MRSAPAQNTGFVLPVGVGLDDADPDVVVVLHLVDGGLHRLGDVTVDGVAGVGTIEGDERDALAGFVGDDVGHGRGS